MNMNHKNKPQDFESPLSPDEIRAIGEIELGPSKTDQFLDRNYKKIIGAGVTIILLFSAYVTYNSFHEDRAKTAGNQLTLAWIPSQGRYDIAQLTSVEENFAGTPAANTATLLRLTENLTQGDPAKASADLETFISSAPNEENKLQAAINLANYYSKNGKLDDAARLYELVSEAKNEFYSPMALMNLGDIARQRGEQDRANDLYLSLMDSYPDSQLVIGNFGVNPRIDLLGIKEPESKLPIPEKMKMPELEAPKAIQ